MAKRSRKRKLPAPDDLPGAELEVLACLWNRPGATAVEIRDSLHTFRPLTHGSVVTLLKRLSAKSLVTRQKAKRGKAFVYFAAHEAERGYRGILKRLVQRVFGGNSVALVASLLESNTPNAAQLQQIKQLLDNLADETSDTREGA